MKRLEEESKKSNVWDVSCVAILSGRMTGVGGQSIAYVRKKQYLCRRIQRSTIKLFHNKCGCLEFSSSRCKHYVRFTSGALQGWDINTRKRDVRSANDMRTKMNRNNQDYESRIDNSYRKFTRCVEEGWLLLPDMQRTADRAEVPEEMDGYASTESCTRTLHSQI